MNWLDMLGYAGVSASANLRSFRELLNSDYRFLRGLLAGLAGQGNGMSIR